MSRLKFKGSSGAIKGAIILLTLAFIAASVSYIIPGLANTHTSTITLDNTVVAGGVNDHPFTATVCNDAGSSHDVREFRIYYEWEDFTDFQDVQCQSKTGWDKVVLNTIWGYACVYSSENEANNIEPGECTDFEFTADTPVEECCRELRFETTDEEMPIGDVNRIDTDICVDATDPETTKEYGIPTKVVGDYRWITSDTPISLNATDCPGGCDRDNGPHDAGIYKIYWRNTLLEIPDYDCIEACQFVGEGDWNEHEGNTTTFYKTEDSCHLIEFYAEDNLGHTETIKKQCVFVDNTPPISDKTHGTPIVSDCGFDWVNQSTTITLDCDDSHEGTVDHPVEQETLCFKVSLHDEPDPLVYLTLSYCNEFGGFYDLITEYCCVYVGDNPLQIHFLEDSYHNLEYYCVDHLGNDERDYNLANPPEPPEEITQDGAWIQWYKVDTVPPSIEKEMLGNYIDDDTCPPEPAEDCYVADDGESGVRVYFDDDGPNDDIICAVDSVTCEYEVWWHTDETTCTKSGGTYEAGRCLIDSGTIPDGMDDYFDILFTEDSTHDVEIECWDELGNANSDVETFLVDSLPPVTTKIFGEPFIEDWYPKGCYEDCVAECANPGGQPCIDMCLDENCGWAEWISSNTSINLTAEDNKVGVDKTWYYNEVLEGPGQLACMYPEENCNLDSLLGDNGNGDGFPCCIGNHYFCPEGYPKECIDEVQDWCTDNWEIEEYDSWEDCVEEEAYYNCCGGFCWNLYRDELFYKPEESCHVLYYFSVDELGNVEDINVNCFFVDNTPPELEKQVGTPQEIIGDYTYITKETEITLSCWDSDPHPVDHVSLWYRYRVSDDCETWGEWLTDGCEGEVVNGWCDPNGHVVDKIIHFPQDSCHELEYYCVDGLGNRVGDNYLAVDMEDLTSFTRIGGRGDVTWDGDHTIFIDDENGYSSGDVYTIELGDGSKLIVFSACVDGSDRVTVEDGKLTMEHSTSNPIGSMGDCPQDYWNIIKIDGVEYRVTLNDDDSYMINDQPFIEIDVVDNQPPEITKTIVGPKMNCPDVIGGPAELCDGWACLDGLTKDFFTTGRYGDGNPTAGAWELAIWENTSSGEVVRDQDNYGWTSGVEVDFSVSYDPSDGKVTYTVDGNTLEWNYDSGKAFDYIIPFAKGNANGNSVELSNMVLNGKPLPFLSSGDSYKGVKVPLSDTQQFDGFTLTGKAKLMWDANPKNEIPGFHVYAMNTHDREDCYIDGETVIHVEVVDPDPHPVDEVVCKWDYEVTDGDKTGEGQIDLTPPFDIQFPEESTHKLTIKCEDALHNAVEDVETFIVDKTPPEIHKDYGCPHYEEEVCLEWGGCCQKTCIHSEMVEWISDNTEITITVEDAGPHKSGIKESKYRYDVVDDDYCWGILDCEEATTDEEWIPMGDPTFTQFIIEEDSCHLIEIYTEDNVGKSDTHKQCVFVDTEGPEPVKEIGEPKDEWHPGEDGDPVSYFYEETEHCWDGTEYEIDCWEATTLTPIVMNCEDPGDHPVGEKMICFKVDVDGEDKTLDYCMEYGGWYNWFSGYCCRWLMPENENDKHENCDFFPYKDKCDEVQDIECYDNRKLFYFLEETEHNLQYYCYDKLWNEGPVDEEKFKIEGNKFEIPLFKKWNLISVPFTLLNDDPEVVFDKLFFDGKQIPYEEIGDYIDSVTTYDPEHVICGQDWCIWTPGEEPDNLRILPGWGYWVMVYDKPEEECIWGPWCFWWEDNEEPLWMVIGGSLFSPAQTPPSRQLLKGWNLIGYYGTKWEDYEWSDFDFMCGEGFGFGWDKYLYGDKVYCALNSLIDTQEGYPRWSSLWSYINCGNHNTDWLGLNACIDPSPFAAQDRMYAGRGYWLELDVPDIYAPATNCIWNDDFQCVNSGGMFLI